MENFRFKAGYTRVPDIRHLQGMKDESPYIWGGGGNGGQQEQEGQEDDEMGKDEDKKENYDDDEEEEVMEWQRQTNV